MKTAMALIVSVCCLVTGILVSCSSSPQEAHGSSGYPYKTVEEYNATLPEDVYPDSRSRIPLAKREELDEEGKRIYDEHIAPNRTSLAGLQGPGGLRLHGSRDIQGGGTGVSRRLQELARLVVSREMDQVFEWTVHEPVALREGLDPAIIDIIRYRKPLTGVSETEASIIQLGREIFQNHKVSSETFARVLKQVGKKDLMDLCYLMGNYTRTAVLLTTVNQHLPWDREPLLPVP